MKNKPFWSGIVEGVLMVEHFDNPPTTRLSFLGQGRDNSIVVDRVEFERAILAAPENNTQATLLRLAQIEKSQGEELHGEKPARWHEASKWRCLHVHVIEGRSKGDSLGRGICPTCSSPSYLTFPEDKAGPLSVPV